MSIHTVEITSDDELDMEARAKQAAEVLMRHYPNHLWAIGWTLGNNLVVKNLAISSMYGFVIPLARIHSESELTRRLVAAGGELLERAGMRRGVWEGEFATNLEGADPRFAPKMQ